MPEAVLRPATRADAQGIATLFRAARAAAMPWLPVLHDPASDLVFFRDRVLSEAEVTLTHRNGALAGFVAVTDDTIDHLYIHPDHWRHGLGRRLVMAAQASRPRLSLWTFQGNAAARAFYAACEFVEVDTTDGARNEERTPDVRFAWRRD